MKTTRLNTNKKVTRIKSKTTSAIKVVNDYVDTLAGRTVVLKSIPTNVKRAKRLFEVGKKYEIQKPLNKFCNTLMAVNLKGSDGVIYYIQFTHWILTAN